MLAIDQTLIIYDLHRNLVNRGKIVDPLAKTFKSIEWLLDDLLFCVYSGSEDDGGCLAIFDIGLNRLDLNYMTRFKLKCSSLGEHLNERLTKRNKLAALVSSRTISHDSLWSFFSFANGPPLGLFRLALPNNFNCIALITHYLKCSQFDDSENSRYLNGAVQLMRALDWDHDGYAALTCLYKCMNFLLSQNYATTNGDFSRIY